MYDRNVMAESRKGHFVFVAQSRGTKHARANTRSTPTKYLAGTMLSLVGPALNG
jgi:hypothetical protein